jgi:hypothetical protein
MFNIMSDERLHVLLLKIDQDLAEKTRLGGCLCGGTLHQANYPRTPTGLPDRLHTHYQYRYSFCCEQCRRRITAPSVRFFGRYWFPAPLLILLSAIKLGSAPHRCAQIRKHFGILINASSWKRWRFWWQEIFTTGFIPIANLSGPFPRVLLNSFRGAFKERFVFLLQFLSPLTSGFLRAI